MILALDLSTTCTGIAYFSAAGVLEQYADIVPDDKLHPFEKIHFIVTELIKHFMESDELVVEGIFLNTFAGGLHNVTGFELLARLSGAVIDEWIRMKGKIPTLLKASEARPLVGLKGSCQKAEVQLWVIRNFTNRQFHPEVKGLDDYDHMIDAEYAACITKDISKAVFKSHMEKISKMIQEKSGIGEDKADAILLGAAYVQRKRNQTNNKDPQ
jgi:hypothetical protein